VQEDQTDRMDWSKVIKAETAATDPDIACRELLTNMLTCLEVLLSCSALAKPTHLPCLTAILAKFSSGSAANCEGIVNNTSKSLWHPTLHAPKLTELVGLLEPSYDFFEGLLRGTSGTFEHELLITKILKAITDIPSLVLLGCAVADVGIVEHLPQMQRQVRLFTQPLQPHEENIFCFWCHLGTA
jgi:hypothetical protein